MGAAGDDAARDVADRASLLADLHAESTLLDDLVSDLGQHRWQHETPAVGWTIAHQIAHLAWTDEKALLAATDTAGFQEELADAAADPEGYVERGARAGARAEPAQLLDRWRRGRAELAHALETQPTGSRIPWYGPPMGVSSMVTARLMETWAHGQDVLDTLGVARLPATRQRHIAWLGVRTRDFAYRVHGRTPPEEEIRVELTGPDQQVWSWGDEDASQRVTGPALDFCFVVTRRRSVSDTELRAEGDDARQWLTIAQAFAGPPGPGRRPGQFG